MNSNKSYKEKSFEKYEIPLQEFKQTKLLINDNLNKQENSIKNNVKFKKRYILSKTLYFFYFIFFYILIFLLHEKILVECNDNQETNTYLTDYGEDFELEDGNPFQNYIKLTFINKGLQKILSDDYKNEEIFEVFVNGARKRSTNNLVKINRITDKVKIKFEKKLSDFSYMFANLKNITTILFNNIFDENINMSNTFYNCQNLKEIIFDVNNMNAIDMNASFYNCHSLISLDLSEFITESTQEMSHIFYNCKKLSDITIGKFYNNLIINMEGIFQNCESLETLNLSLFNTPNVEIMWNMFSGCKSLKELNLSSFDTSKVTDMESMFEGCSDLVSLDLENFNTSNVQYMNKMFRNCRKLKIINLMSFTTESLGTMHQMFYKCQSLEYLNIYSLTEDVQSIFEMFEGASNTFSFCIKENENIPNIFEELKKRDTIRDCSNTCYNGTERIGIPDKKLCCPFLEYNGECYDYCPSRTMPGEDNKTCQIFNCPYYYNYSQDGCIDNIPDGYYMNDTELRTIDKCHENCKTCKGKETNITTNCITCKESAPFIYLGNCYSTCEKSTYIDSDGNTKCKCFKDKCLKCSEESLDLDLCISCNEGYYEKYNEIITNSSFVNCYKNPELYYLDTNIYKYKECYHSCQYCSKLGDKQNHFCISCNSKNSFAIPMEGNQNYTNCYPQCEFNYYFDEDYNYKCFNESGCPPELKYMVDGKNECINSCKGTKYSYEFRKKCYEKCPIESVPFSNLTGNYCKSDCPFEKPFEMVELQICVSKCTIMERYNKLCVTNYKKNGSSEIQDMVIEDIQDDIVDTFNYSIITNNLSIILEEKDFFYEITSTNTTTSDPRISRIDLGECETVLKDYYEIDKEEPLYILKVDAYIEGKVGPKIEYEVYYPFNGVNLNLLDLSKCEGIDIFLGFPVNISEENLDLYDGNSDFYSDICYSYTNENGTDVTLSDRRNEYEKNNISLCEENCNYAGYNKKTGSIQCSCSVKISIPSISDIKIDKKKLYKFMDIKTIVNFKIMKCYNAFLSKKGIIKNIGFYCFIPAFLMFMISIILTYKKEFQLLKVQINEIVFAKRNLKYLDPKFMKEKKKSIFQIFLEKRGINLNSIDNYDNIKGNNKNKSLFKNGKEKKNKYGYDIKNKNKLILMDENINKNDNINNINDNIEIHKGMDGYDEFSKNDDNNGISKDNNSINNKNLIRKINMLKKYKNKIRDSLKDKIENSDFTKKSLLKKKEIYANNKPLIPKFSDKQKQKIKDILKYTNSELDDMEYKKALLYDHRTFKQNYLSLLKSNHLVIKIFDKTDYNSRSIKLFLVFFNFVSCYAVNAFFFSDDTMHRIYEDGGDFNFIYQLPQIIYSTIISFIIDNITDYFAMSHEDIIQLKKEKKIKKIGKKAIETIRTIRLKLIAFFIVSFLFMLLFWYYLGCFCAVYKNTQYHLIKDTLISFATGNLSSFATSLIPSFLRVHSLSQFSNGKELIYKLSQFISKFC